MEQERKHSRFVLVIGVGDLKLPLDLKYASQDELRSYWKEEQTEAYNEARKYFSLDEIIEKAKRAVNNWDKFD